MSSMKHNEAKTYWRSLTEWADDPALAARLQHEFPSSPLTGAEAQLGRRRFMQLMGASMALSTGAACRWEKDHLLAFTRRPAGHVPGVPKHFATTMELGGVGSGLSVTSYDGRPIKVDGNRKHPTSGGGGSSSFEQASVLELYDPDRSQQPVRRGVASGGVGHASWDDFAIEAGALLQAAQTSGGRELAVLSEATSSPTVLRLRAALQARYPAMRWVTYEPLAHDNERQGTERAFGQQLRPRLHMREARVILTLDEELFCDHAAANLHGADFAAARRPEGDFMARLWAVESRHSATGAAADHRLALRSAQVEPLLLAVMAELVRSGELSGAADLAALKGFEARGFLAKPDVKAFVAALAADLRAAHGQSVICAGEGQSAQVHQLVAQLNAILGNVGRTVTYVAEPEPSRPPQLAAMESLAADMVAGKIKALFVLGGNPTYNAPASFAAAFDKVPFTAHLSLFRDETSAHCTWHLPRSHYLEAWGDTRAIDGTVSLGQPLLEPLYDTRTAAQFLSVLLGDAKTDMALTHATFAQDHNLEGDALDHGLRKVLHDGFVTGTAWAKQAPTRRPLSLTKLSPEAFAENVDNGALELSFWPDPRVYDGRFANNGWLQELPDFVAKLTWDNAAFVAPATARRLGLKHEHMLTLTCNGRTLEVACYVLPGQAEGSVAVTLGYGRTQAGHVAGMQHAFNNVPSAGFNTYTLRNNAAENFIGALRVQDTGRHFPLAITQDHHSMDALAQDTINRRAPQIVREADFAAYKEDPAFAKEVVEHPPLKSLWDELKYEGYRWGMAIDLNSCTGCGSCVVACQAENNIPVVGKEQVINGREMHWLRIDRYFTGSPEAPTVTSQPMTCQHCELAPCESVCPVAATVHDQDGLNVMVYNRCIGTRYCSNNCPYKVRRFNFFNYHKSLEKDENQVTKMAYNPEVTVRARGVMEKCTYCTQRIQAVKIDARNKRRPIRDGEVVPACAEACASNAIVFGDLNDKESRVYRHHQSPRAYGVLEELNTKPRTQYLARVRNPHPMLAKATRPAPHKPPGAHPRPAEHPVPAAREG